MGLTSILSRSPRSIQEESKNVSQFVSFRIGEEEFGVDILMVQEIIRVPPITPIPNADRSILGMINLRGRIIPVIDLRQRLSIRSRNGNETNKKTRILIVEMNKHVTGFIVDSVSEVMKVPVAEIEPTPHLVTSSIDSQYARGVIKLPNRLIMLLDFHQLLSPREERELKRIGSNALSAASREQAGEVDISFNISINPHDPPSPNRG